MKEISSRLASMKKRTRETTTDDSRSGADKLISEAMAELARRRAAAQTPEERTAQARRAVKQRWKKAGAEGRAAIGRMLTEARKKAAKARKVAEASDKPKARTQGRK